MFKKVSALVERLGKQLMIMRSRVRETESQRNFRIFDGCHDNAPTTYRTLIDCKSLMVGRKTTIKTNKIWVLSTKSYLSVY